ncbi:MAG TPA: arabinan endo-1,5-alpha-L-arabinosidase, partial [Ardenticatenaceae bacterium]|nr:arabinan endo-1,5-alpha-L-arabinosidase [Ardenticatenaceae bacterium]
MRTRYPARLQLAIMLVLVLLTACNRDRAAPERLTGDVQTHDPGMIRQDQTYYVFSTGDERLNEGNIQIRKSADLAHWELVGTVFETTPAWIGETLGSRPPNLWAPDIAYLNAQYHLYYAGSRFGSNNSVIGLATNVTLDPQSPDYAWVDQGMVIRSRVNNNWNAIDPSVSFDADGAPWLAFGSFWDGIMMRRLDAASGMLSTEDTTLYALASRDGGPIEAPAIVYRDGFYYLFVSFDFCCRGVDSTYKIMVGRAASITGPYTDRNGTPMEEGWGDLLLDGDERLRGPGGQSVYLDGGTYRLVYHTYDRLKNGLPQLQIR